MVTLIFLGGIDGSEDFIDDFNVSEDSLMFAGAALANVNTLYLRRPSGTNSRVLKLSDENLANLLLEYQNLGI